MRSEPVEEFELLPDFVDAGTAPEPESEPKDAITIAVREVLRGKTTRVLKRVSKGEPLCVVLAPTHADWCRPIGRAIAKAMRDAEKPAYGVPPAVLTRHEAASRISTRESERSGVIERLSAGLPVVGVSHLPEMCLPDAMVRAADVVLRLGPLSGHKLRRIIRETTGEDPGRVSSDLAAAVTIDDIGACVRPGGGAKASLARLEAARAARTRTREIDAPPLEALAGYGAAKVWGELLKRELERYRAGEIGLTDLPRGLLLSGSPGTGKTLFAQSLARSCGLPLIATSAARWMSAGDGNLDDAIKALRADFEAAIAVRPALLLIDEIDALVDPSQIGSHGRAWWLSFRAALLSTIDGASSVPGVVLIGACNHVGLVDEALKRAGRLDRHIAIALPDRAARIQIFRVQLDGALIGEDLDPLGDLSSGLSGADIARVVRDARARARDAGRPLLVEDLRALLAPQDDRARDELQRVALHEAGHAVAATLLGQTVESVSIQRTAGAHGRAFVETPLRLTREAVQDLVLVALAGRAADVVLGEGPCAGSSADLVRASALLGRLHAAYGLGHTLVSVGEEHIERLIAADPGLRAIVARELDEIWRRAVALVRTNAGLVETVASALVHERVLGAQRLHALLHQGSRGIGSRQAAGT